MLSGQFLRSVSVKQGAAVMVFSRCNPDCRPRHQLEPRQGFFTSPACPDSSAIDVQEWFHMRDALVRSNPVMYSVARSNPEENRDKKVIKSNF